MKTAYRELLESIYRQHHAPVTRWLQRKFPGVTFAEVQDAVADTFTEALERPQAFVQADSRGGRPELVRLLRQVAWRRLRGLRRRKAARYERLGLDDNHLERRHEITPMVEVSGRETLRRALVLVDEAAQRFGGTHAQALRQALRLRFTGGTDTEAARACGVPREYVNRAKRWIGTRLAMSENPA